VSLSVVGIRTVKEGILEVQRGITTNKHKTIMAIIHSEQLMYWWTPSQVEQTSWRNKADTFCRVTKATLDNSFGQNLKPLLGTAFQWGKFLAARKDTMDGQLYGV